MKSIYIIVIIKMHHLLLMSYGLRTALVRINHAMNIVPNEYDRTNETGEYYGLGPTCRCQETMRYYYYLNDIHKSFDWFIFMDDDIYIRPYSLLSFLLGDVTALDPAHH
jgi:hypothetical protein